MRLNELRQRDFRQVADLSADMMACRDFVELENCIHANIRNIVDGDVSIWNLINLDGTIIYASTQPEFDDKFWGNIAPVISADILQHPMLQVLSSLRPLSLVNLNSETSFYNEYLKSDLYFNAYAKWDCLDQCQGSFLAEPGTYLNVSVNRPQRSFTKRDLQAFQLLIPLLSDIFKLVRRRQNLELQIEDGLRHQTNVNHFWIIISSLLYIRNGSPNAQAMLRNLFPGHFSLVDLPQTLDVELRRVMAGFVPGVQSKAQFAITTPSSRVDFELEQVDPVTFKLTGTLPGSTSPHHDFLSEIPLNTSLSPRELDVLGWTLEGKLSPEIGIILGISPKTVEKHLNSIYDKLGAHSRAEVIRALAPEREFNM